MYGIAVKTGTRAIRASSSGPLTDGLSTSRNQARPTPLPNDAHEPNKRDSHAVGAGRASRAARRLAQAEALGLAVLLEFLRDLGLHLLRLDFAIARLGIVVVARQFAVLTLDLRISRSSRAS